MMDLRNYTFQITGISPLILHNDDVDWADFISAWRDDPANRPYMKAKGDDRVPGFLWIGSLYHDDTNIVMPAANLHRALRDAAAKISTGKRQETFKRQSQSGMQPTEAAFPLHVPHATVPYAPFRTLAETQERAFPIHRAVVQDHGFDLHVKRVPVTRGSKHIRVRPIFGQWSCNGRVQVWDDTITTEVLRRMFLMTGDLVGLGDWRPSAPEAPGHYGRFTSVVEEG
jgi:hypothetical protein